MWKFCEKALVSETMRKLCLSTKSPHQEIRRNYSSVPNCKGVKLQISGKKTPQVHLIIVREQPKNNPHHFHKSWQIFPWSILFEPPLPSPYNLAQKSTAFYAVIQNATAKGQKENENAKMNENIFLFKIIINMMRSFKFRQLIWNMWNSCKILKLLQNSLNFKHNILQKCWR